MPAAVRRHENGIVSSCIPSPLRLLSRLERLSPLARGVALFTIARQDGSRAGQILGVAIPMVAMIVAIYLVL